MSEQVTVNAAWLAELTRERDALLKDRERLRKALQEIANDDTQEQKPYHFFSIARKVLASVEEAEKWT